MALNLIVPVCYDTTMQTQEQPTITIPVSTLERLTRAVKTMLSVVEELKTQAQPGKFVPTDMVLSDSEFEKLSEQLESALSDLSEQEHDQLSQEAVTWAKQSHAS